jgi:hypothetical protein
MLIPLDQVIGFFLICGTLVGVYMRLNNKIIRSEEQVKTLFNIQKKVDDAIEKMTESLNENSTAITALQSFLKNFKYN